MARIVIGTSGWQYSDWKERFYPKEVKQATWLEFYAESFQTVEVNNTFYRLPEAQTFEDWARRTPDDFIFTVKVSRYLTHIKRLKDPLEPVDRLMSRAAKLGDKLGPLLIQLPPNLEVDKGALQSTLSAFPPGSKLVVEFRHPSWFTPEIEEVLTAHGAALCLADRGGSAITPLSRTADWGYLRFHQGESSPHPCYSTEVLRMWAQRIAELWPGDAPVFVYFNNDTLGCAVRDAITFVEECGDEGMRASRVPELEGVRVG